MIKIHLYQKLKTELLDLIFPKKCLGCHQEGEWICESCFQKILKEKSIIRQLKNLRVYACGSYKTKIFQNIINYLKYHGITDLAPEGAKIMVSLISTNDNQNFDLITSIPLHRKRLNQRTFNQAELLAREISKLLKIEYADLLNRQRYSESQTHLSDEERRKNVERIFIPIKTQAQKMIGKKILLIDDVVTSGATIEEAAKILIKNGVYKVTGLCLASR